MDGPTSSFFLGDADRSRPIHRRWKKNDNFSVLFWPWTDGCGGTNITETYRSFCARRHKMGKTTVKKKQTTIKCSFSYLLLIDGQKYNNRCIRSNQLANSSHHKNTSCTSVDCTAIPRQLTKTVD